MSLVLEGVYDSGIVTLKSNIKIPDKSEGLAMIRKRKAVLAVEIGVRLVLKGGSLGGILTGDE